MSIIRMVCDALCISPHELKNFAATAPHRYKVYEIEKRSGAGTRTIAHPSKELKFIQRIIVSLLEEKLTIHHTAYAYKKSISIKDNALIHANNRYLLKMDLKDFFPSITPKIFRACLTKSNISLDDNDLNFLDNVLFWKQRRNSTLKLSIGAPSSPLISNFIMLSFDEYISDFCLLHGIKYTRYADDLSFSTNVKDLLFNIPNEVKSTLAREFGASISINTDKTVFSSKGHNRHITGVTLTNDNKISIGRNRKRIISSMVHHFKNGQLDAKDIEVLKGILAFASFIDSDLYQQFSKKYGDETMSKLVKNKIPT